MLSLDLHGGLPSRGPGPLEWEPCSPCGWGPSSCNSLAFSKLISVGSEAATQRNCRVNLLGYQEPWVCYKN